MTEEEWLAATEPTAMLEFLRKASPRKLRLFACACCQRFYDDSEVRSVVLMQAAERFADSEITEATRKILRRDAFTAEWWSPAKACVSAALARRPDEAAMGAAARAGYIYDGTTQAHRAEGATLLREIFGNPFRPVTFDPAWRTSTAVAVADAIYADRTFGNLPVLADALQDAGCEHADLLSHLRGPGPHVRGCWALDLVLGKE